MQDCYARVQFARSIAADIFISIHCNSSGTVDRLSGSSTYYCGARNLPLARAMQASLVRTLNLRDAGLHQGCQFVVVREPPMPAVLLELAFFRNRKEEALLATAEFRQRCAEAITAGLKDYVEGGGLMASQVETAPETAPPEPAQETPAAPTDSGAAGEGDAQ